MASFTRRSTPSDPAALPVPGGAAAGAGAPPPLSAGIASGAAAAASAAGAPPVAAPAPGVISPSDELELLVRARYPLLYVTSWEEERVMAALEVIADRLGKKVYEWSINRGLMRTRSAADARADGKPGTKDPIVLLREVRQIAEPALVVLKDFHPYLKDSAVVRGLRELAAALRQTYTTTILLSPTLELPQELEKDTTVVEFPLPAKPDLRLLIDSIRAEVGASGARYAITQAPEEIEPLVNAALGLTLFEAENVFAKALVLTGRLSAQEVPFVYSEKKQIILKTGLLEYVEVGEDLKTVGGLAKLKAWLLKRRLAFSERAQSFGLPVPRGILILGVQGCGKSLCAKAVAHEWEMPLLRLDMGRVFSSYVGESESNVRRAIRLAESMSPVVLWIDEIDKGLAGMKGGASADSGTSQRVFGTIITWLQEKTHPVFVIATANQIDLLPPEILRKGRFDEIFFVDLPQERERREIFGIHLAKRRRDPRRFDLDGLARSSEGLSGAEIEAVIVAALYDAYERNQDLATDLILQSLRESVPLSVTMREDIERLRLWARGRARPASDLPPPNLPGGFGGASGGAQMGAAGGMNTMGGGGNAPLPPAFYQNLPGS